MADSQTSGASTDSVEALLTRVAALEAENEALRTPAGVPPRARRSPGRATLASILIVLGLIAGTAGLVTAYAKQQLLNTTTFVSAFAPLAKDPAVQGMVSDAVTSAINDAVDIPALTADVISGIRDLGLPPRADAALDLLEIPAAQAVQGLIDASVERTVASDAFSAAWEHALRISHTQMMATLHGEDDAVLEISDSALQLQIGPLVAEAKERLLDNGITLAEAVPAVDRSIVLVEHRALEQLRTGVYAVDMGGTWLPWASLFLLAAGVALARRPRRMVIVAAVITALLMTIVVVGISVAGNVLVRTVDRGPGVVTGAAVQSLFDAATGVLSHMGMAVATLAIVVAGVAWFVGPARFATAVRSATVVAAQNARSRAEQHGISTGRLGVWVERQHRSVLVAVGIIAAVVVLLCRPLSPAVVICTAVVSIIIVVVVQFVRRPAVPLPASVTTLPQESAQNA